VAGIFKIIETRHKKEADKKGISLGIDLKIADREISFPVTEVSHSEKDFFDEVEKIREDLNRLLEKGRRLFKRSSSDDSPQITAEMEPEKIWSILSGISKENLFVEIFNDMEAAKRMEVAEHVLSHCNIFSGKGAVFSARYDNETGLMK
jgi:hypothetical protein